MWRHETRIEYWYWTMMMVPVCAGNRYCLIVHVGAAVADLVVAVVVLWMSIVGEWIRQKIHLNGVVVGYMDGVILCRVIRI